MTTIQTPEPAAAAAATTEHPKITYELAYNVLQTIHRQEWDILRWSMDRMHKPEIATDERVAGLAKEQVVAYFRASAAAHGQLLPGWLHERMNEHTQGFSLELREYAFRTVKGEEAYQAAKKRACGRIVYGIGDATFAGLMPYLNPYIEEAGKYEDDDSDADATDTGNTAVSSDNGAGGVDSHVAQAEADTGEAAGIGDA